jgi:hypothetical protein
MVLGQRIPGLTELGEGLLFGNWLIHLLAH